MQKGAKLIVFISGRMAELRAPRVRLEKALASFCNVILAEDSPDSREPEGKSLEWARECDIYLGVYGESYGHEPPSITHQEFREARDHTKPLIVFVKGGIESVTNQRQREFLQEVKKSVTCKRFGTKDEITDEATDELCREALRHLKHEADRLSRDVRRSFSWQGVRATVTLAKLEARSQYKKAAESYKRLLAHDKPWLEDYVLEELAWLYQALKRWNGTEDVLQQRIEAFTVLPTLIAEEDVEDDEEWFLKRLGFSLGKEQDRGGRDDEDQDDKEQDDEEQDDEEQDDEEQDDHWAWMLADYERAYKFRERQGSLARCYLLHAQSWMDQGDIEKAIAKLKSPELGEALEYSQDGAVRLDAQTLNAQAHIGLAHRYFRKGEYDNGFLVCDDALNIIRELNNADLLEMLIQSYLEAAQKCFDSGQVCDGERFLTQAVGIGKEFSNSRLEDLAWQRNLALRYNFGIGSLKKGYRAVDERLDCLERSKARPEFEAEESLGRGLVEVTRNAISEIKEAREKWGV